MSRAKAPKSSVETPGAKNDIISTKNSDPSILPSLNEGSFKLLQDKIQQKLQKRDGQKAEKKQKGTKPSDKDAQHVLNRGKKRSSDGAVKKERTIAHPSTGSNAISTQLIETNIEEELKQALKELGGTQEDVDLFADADSDSEVEGTTTVPTKHAAQKNNKDLEKGMANIMKEIELAQGARENATYDVSDSTSQETPSPERDLPSTKTNNSLRDTRLTCEPRADWFRIPSPNVNLEKGGEYTPTQYMFEQLHAHAKTLLEADNEAFKATQQSSSSQAFYNTVIASGTLSDKISALTLAVQESPVHNVEALRTLVSLATKRNRAQSLDVLRALKDLLAQGSLLPADRRLYTFSTQPAVVAALGQVRSWRQGDKLPRGISDSDLVCWSYESWLKEQYFDILKSLESWCNDEIEFSKQRAVSYIYELLREKPEQESNLLRLLVNKLGDPVKKIASQTSYLLMQLLVSHPAMKMVVITAIEADFLFRPGQSMYGKYYAITTLNQTALSSKEEDVAQKLLDVYFGMFTGLLKVAGDKPDETAKEGLDGNDVEGVVSLNRRQQQRRKGGKQKPINAQGEELREKLISAVLTGVNRAYPYVGADQRNFNQHLDTLFAITHAANFNTSIQAMLLIQQLTSTSQAASDRFYRTLYESLLDPRLVTASKQQLYLNLLHRSLKTEVSIKRVKAFVRRLLQILSLHDPSFICGVFFLLKDLEKTFPSLTALFDTSVDLEDEEEVFRDVDEDATVAPAISESRVSRQYNGHKRAPEHANADNSNAWELLPFLAHFHPSVSVSAENYLQQLKLPGKPDLTLHTMIHFLDRFVYRNPKLSSNKMRGASIMQPMASDDTHAVLLSSGTGRLGPAVNTEEFRNKKNADVAVDDAFFHKYFSNLGKEGKPKQARKQRIADDNGSIGDEAEDEVWKAMMDSAPDLEGAESDDGDLSMSDFEAEMDNEDSSEALNNDDQDDSEVDVEAGIFDDIENEISLDGTGDEEQPESDFEGVSSSNEMVAAKTQRNKNTREERKKKKSLPTFASAADYAKMLEDDEDEDMG